MLEILNGNELLSIFLIIVLGTLFGMIPFGPLRFGAAGALFVGLAFGSFIDLDGTILSNLQEMGLGLFIYMQGLSAGERFFKGLSKQLSTMLAAVIASILAAVAAVVVGKLMGVDLLAAIGVFAGATTSTASLAVAQQQTGSDVAAVGYSLGYPVGVAVAIILVAIVLKQNWPAKRDQEDTGAKVFRTINVLVMRDIDQDQLTEEFEGQYVIATVRRKGNLHVADDARDLHRGDRIRVMVTRSIEKDFVKRVGKKQTQTPFIDKQLVIETVTVSNEDIAGRSVEELNVYRRFGGKIVRVRRGDEVVLAKADTHLAYGDVVEVIIKFDHLEALREYFGDSVASYAQLNWVSVAGGLFIGYLVALITIPLPGGSSFELGFALGPLLAGLVLGALHRTRRIPWQVPASINTAFQQWGLMIFLAAVGLASGEAFLSTAFSWNGVKAMGLAAVVTSVLVLSFCLMSFLLGKSETRAVGGVSGIFGQPAIVNYATGVNSDNRIMTGYASTIVAGTVIKIVVVPFMLMF